MSKGWLHSTSFFFFWSKHSTSFCCFKSQVWNQIYYPSILQQRCNQLLAWNCMTICFFYYMFTLLLQVCFCRACCNLLCSSLLVLYYIAFMKCCITFRPLIMDTYFSSREGGEIWTWNLIRQVERKTTKFIRVGASISIDLDWGAVLVLFTVLLKYFTCFWCL